MTRDKTQRVLDELNIELQYKGPVASSGALMTLPAAAADLRDCITDHRKIGSMPYDDWMQVITDFRDSVDGSGLQLSRHVESVTTDIESLLPALISLDTSAQPTSPITLIDSKVVTAQSSRQDCSADRFVARKVGAAQQEPQRSPFIHHGRVCAGGHPPSFRCAGHRANDRRSHCRRMDRLEEVSRDVESLRRGGGLPTRHSLCSRASPKSRSQCRYRCHWRCATTT